MKAIVLNQNTYKFEIKEVKQPDISSACVLVKLKASAINHHELWSLQEKEIKSNEDIILGSDGSGLIKEVGAHVNDFKKGDEVVINPSLNWGSDAQVQAENYQILGYPTQGTFAEYIALDHKYIEHKPKNLSFQEAAAVPLAGLTAYRALFTQGKIKVNQKVLITGIGGGVALFVLTFAIAMGAEVYVTSGDDNKIAKAIALGTKAGANYKGHSWKKELIDQANGFDIIIDSAAGPDFAGLTELAKPGGRIVLFGRTAGNISNLDPKTIFWKQLSIQGTTMGNAQEFKDMMNFISSKNISPVIDSIYSPYEINSAYNRMYESNQFGKMVIDWENF